MFDDLGSLIIGISPGKLNHIELGCINYLLIKHPLSIAQATICLGQEVILVATKVGIACV